jgi:feruloyl esterase
MSVGYYEAAQRATPALDDSYRLFMVPGMQHCGGGDAPNVLDPVSTVIDWVEGGKAPASMIAVQQKADGSVLRARPVCPYPQAAHYLGGDADQAASFACR